MLNGRHLEKIQNKILLLFSDKRLHKKKANGQTDGKQRVSSIFI